jgi:hypothetical protein
MNNEAPKTYKAFSRCDLEAIEKMAMLIQVAYQLIGNQCCELPETHPSKQQLLKWMDRYAAEGHHAADSDIGILCEYAFDALDDEVEDRE